MMYQDPQPSMTTRHRLLLVNQIGLILGILSSTYDPCDRALSVNFWDRHRAVFLEKLESKEIYYIYSIYYKYNALGRSDRHGPAFWNFSRDSRINVIKGFGVQT